MIGKIYAAGYENIESIRFQAENFIMQYPYDMPYLPIIRTEKLDSRLRLKDCPQPLQTQFTHQNKIYGNTAVTVSCTVTPRWKINLPVTINLYDDVLIAATPLHKGQTIDSHIVKFEKHAVSKLHSGYFTQDSDLQYLEASRNLPKGSILTQANLKPRQMVKSGQKVTLILDYKGIRIKSTGKALQSAHMGQTIKVKNIQSNKIVEGIVSGEGMVKVSI